MCTRRIGIRSNDHSTRCTRAAVSRKLTRGEGDAESRSWKYGNFYYFCGGASRAHRIYSLKQFQML